MTPGMTDPAGSDRIQQGVPTASGTGDDLPARADSDVAQAAGGGDDR